ncbi:hypothetical protein [Mangrovactinospora gilvigrisea]|nr:hypothetical protein [Mangrovactinospora gilvigrisea]
MTSTNSRQKIKCQDPDGCNERAGQFPLKVDGKMLMLCPRHLAKRQK